MFKNRKARLLLDGLLADLETRAARRRFLLCHFIPYVMALLGESLRRVVDWKL